MSHQEQEHDAGNTLPLWEALVIVALFLLGLGLRLYGLGTEALWADEFYTLRTIESESLSAFWQHLTTQDPHPPVYFGFMYFYSHLIGTASDTLLRLPSAVASVGFLLSMIVLSHRLYENHPIARYTVITLAAISPFSLWYGQEARPYGFLLFFLTAAFLCLQLMITAQRHRTIAAACWVGFSLLAVYTHYFSAFAMVAMLIIVAVEYYGGEIEERLRLLIASAALVIGSLISAWMALGNVLSGAGIDWLQPVAFYDIMKESLKAQFVGPLFASEPRELTNAAIFGFVAFIIVAMRRLIHGGKESTNFFETHRMLCYTVGAAMITFLLPIAISTQKPILFYGQRYMIIATPFLILAIGSLIATMQGAWRWTMLLLLPALMAQCFWIKDFHGSRQKRLWDTAASIIDQERPGAEVIVIPDRLVGLYNRYAENSIAYADLDHEPDAIVSLLSDTATINQLGLEHRQFSKGLLEASRPGQELLVLLPK